MRRSKYYSKGSALVTFIIILALLVVIGMAGFIFISKSSRATTSSDTSASVTPDIPVKDYAPNIPMAQKTTLLIQSSDSSMEKYIVPTDQVQTYVKSLPEGYHVVSQSH